MKKRTIGWIVLVLVVAPLVLAGHGFWKRRTLSFGPALWAGNHVKEFFASKDNVVVGADE